MTGRSSTTQYVPLDLFFETNQKLISLRLEAYIVKDMNAPLILGNDFADQYSLSIIRDNGNVSLKLGNSGHSIPLDSLVESSYLDIQALQAKARAILHRKNNKRRRKNSKINQVLILKDQIIPPWSIRKVPV